MLSTEKKITNSTSDLMSIVACEYSDLFLSLLQESFDWIHCPILGEHSVQDLLNGFSDLCSKEDREYDVWMLSRA